VALRIFATMSLHVLLFSLGCADGSKESVNAAAEENLDKQGFGFIAGGYAWPVTEKCDEEAQLPEDGPVCGFIDTEPPSPYSLPDDDDDDGGPFVDESRELKDLGTSFVNTVLFSSPDTLYNFLDEVYGKLDALLASYRQSHGLPDTSISILFKGGNVLRAVARSYFQLLHPVYRDAFENIYGQYFKRSDSDFSIYIDPNVPNYDQVLADITELAFNELGTIRSDFFANPGRYFDFPRFNNEYASGQMIPFLTQAQQVQALKDPENQAWYGANILQMELLKASASDAPACKYHGQFDFKYVRNPATKAIDVTPLSTTRNWIFNSNNQTLTWPWQSDPNHTTSFYLVRSKVAFEYVIEKGGKRENTVVGGELIDVSIPTRQDDNLRHFFEHYDDNVHEYTLVSADGTRQQKVKAYSIKYLTEDLDAILFGLYTRPWLSGGKYEKRLFRVFFLHIIDLLNKSMSAKDQMAYLGAAQQFVDAAKTLFVNGQPSQAAIDHAALRLSYLSQLWPDHEMNNFWNKVLSLMQRLIDSPLDGDADGFNKLMNDFVQTNLNNANIKQVGEAGEPKVDLEQLYTVNLSQLL
jgi:hypothetical protein